MAKLLDFIFVCLIGVGLWFKAALFAIPILTFFKTKTLKLELGYLFLLLSVMWAFFTIFYFKDASINQQILMRYTFVWLLPFFFLLYKPSKNLIHYLKYLVYGLLAFDLFFNLYIYVTGYDFFGREVDLRPGLLATYRSGGLFAHSFYSSCISIISITFLLFSEKRKWILVFALLNLFLSGSTRSLIELILIPIFFWKNEKRSKKSEWIQILVFTTIIIYITYYFNSMINQIDVLNSNSSRIFAWESAIKKVSNNPLFGEGFTGIFDREIGINENTIDENNIAESWFLISSVNFGIPYTILRFTGLILIFYGKTFIKRSNYEKVLVPLTFIDMAYGDSIDALLYSVCLWTILNQRNFDLHNNKLEKI